MKLNVILYKIILGIFILFNKAQIFGAQLRFVLAFKLIKIKLLFSEDVTQE